MSSQYRIGIIGLGYVGLPLAKAFCEKETSVIGFDIDKSKVDSLNQGKSSLGLISRKALKAFIKKKTF